MTDDTVRDGLARALFAARLADGDYPDGTGVWDDVPEDWREACQVLADAALAYLAGQRVDVGAVARVLAEHRVYAEWVTRSGAHYADCCDCGWRGGDYGTGATHQAEMVAALLPTAPEVVTTAADAWDEGFRKGQASETSDPAFWTASKYANPYRPTVDGAR